MSLIWHRALYADTKAFSDPQLGKESDFGIAKKQY
jgi:hypothetical protein